MGEPEFSRAVIWDLDGVLADTEPFHYMAWEKTFHKMGVPFSREDFALAFGLRNSDIVARMLGDLPGEEMERISERKESLFRQALKGKACRCQEPPSGWRN